MFNREELLSSNTYWIETIQNELYSNIVEYMEKENLNQNELAEKLGVTKGYISQILKGEFNFTLKKIVEISLAIGKVPNIEFENLQEYIERDSISSDGIRYTTKSIIPLTRISPNDWVIWKGTTTKNMVGDSTKSVSVESDSYYSEPIAVNY